MIHAIPQPAVPSCPLTGRQKVVHVRTYPLADLIGQWEARLNIDIRPHLPSIGRIDEWFSPECELTFFTPIEAAGGELFYKELQRLPWYYMPDKWEFSAACKYMSRGSRILEVGSGTGTFMEYAKSIASSVVGLETNAEAAEVARAAGWDTRTETVEQHASRSDATYDVVCAFQLLEHLTDPRSFFEACLALLRPGGRIVVAVPNADSFPKHLPFDLLNLPPHHMSRWRRSTFKRLSAFFDVKVLAVVEEPLALHHVGWYWDIQVGRSDNSRVRRVLRGVGNRIAMPLLRSSKALRKIIRGHTILAVMERL